MVTTPLKWLPATFVSGSADDDNYPSITQMTNGNIVVAYTTASPDAPADQPGTDILIQIYNPLGETVGDLVRINTMRSADDESSVRITALEGGGFMATYLDLEVNFGPPVTYNTDIVFQVYDADGVSQRSDVIVDGADELTLENLSPQVASQSDASSIVVWEQNNEHVVAKLVTPSSGFVSSEIVIFSGSTGVAGESVRGVSVTALAGGTSYVVAWGNENAGINDSVQFRTVGLLGNLGSIITVANTLAENYDPAVTALTGGGFVVSWTGDDSGGSDTGVRARVFDATGAFVGGLLTPATTTAGNQLDSTVVALGDGGFVVLWADQLTADLHGQRYSAAGAEVGGEFNIDTSGPVSSPDAVLLEDGRIAISWSHTLGGNDAVLTAIYDTRETANDPDSNGYQIGTPGGDTFTVGTGAVTVAGGEGADRITIAAADVNPLTRITGNGGTDVLVLAAQDGTWDFRTSESVEYFEEVEFQNTGTGFDRTARFDALDLAFVSTFDFDSASSAVETLEVYLGAMTTYNLSGATHLGFDTGQDRMRIFGDGSVETITGSTVGDEIDASAGNDTIFGGAGDDTITGGARGRQPEWRGRFRCPQLCSVGLCGACRSGPCQHGRGQMPQAMRRAIRLPRSPMWSAVAGTTT